MIDMDLLGEINHKIDNLEPGEVFRIEALDESVYHATNACGSSMLKNFIDAPAKYQASLKGELVFSGDSLDLGSATHALVLEPELFDEKFVVMPSEIKRKAGKAWDAFKLANETKTILSQAQHNKVLTMQKAVMDTHAQYFTGGKAEVSYFKRHETGAVIKARIDYEIDDLSVDLKTTKSADPNEWGYSAIKYSYHVQRSLYLIASGLREMVFVCVENEAPFLTSGPFLFDEELKELARLKVEKALRQLAECQELNFWPGYNPGPVLLESKPWHLAELAKLKGEL